MTDFTELRNTMIESQIRTDGVTDPAVLGAIRKISREQFVPDECIPYAYADCPIRLSVKPVARGLPAPRDFALLVQAAGIEPSDVVLDIGCGSGYSTAVLARLADTVVALEEDNILAEKAMGTLAELGADNAVVVKGDLKEGYPGQAPYDIIMLSGAACRIPEGLFSQLAEGGRLVAVVYGAVNGNVRVYEKTGGGVSSRTICKATASVLPGFEAEPDFVFAS
ncbi:MAG: protein-L-isoaspartate O-methyltransferase [Parvularculales bacterium]